MTIQDRTPLLALTKATYVGPSQRNPPARGTRVHGDTPRPEDWRELAACRRAGNKLFFPERTERDGAPPMRDIAAAKLVCSTCPVKQSCYELWVTLSAIERSFGVWFGTSAYERRQSKLAPCRRCGDTFVRLQRNRGMHCPECQQLIRDESVRLANERRMSRAAWAQK